MSPALLQGGGPKSAEEMDEERKEQIVYEYLCRLEEAKKWIEHPSTRRESSSSSFSRFSSRRNDTSIRSSRGSKVKRSPRKITPPKSERESKTSRNKSQTQNEAPLKKSSRSKKTESAAEDYKRNSPGNLPEDLFDVETTDLDLVIVKPKMANFFKK